MSPRAAWRLERLGYGPVYDYAWGKVDWLAAGLPTEGAGRRERRAVDALQEPVTCLPNATVGEARAQALRAGAPNALVVNDERILLGRLRLEAPDVDPEETVDVAMEPGPVTVRANESLDALLERMAKKRVTEIVVTTPEGRLLGVVRP